MLPDPGFLQSTLAEPLGLELHFSVAGGASSTANLSPSEQKRYLTMEHTARAKSWLLGRAALKSLCRKVDGCTESTTGTATDIDTLSFPNSRFSLSHSADMALAVAEPSGKLEGIGVDLEVDTYLQAAAARFFLTHREQRWLRTQASERWPHHLLRLWCIKEAVFKANPGNFGKMLVDHELDVPAQAQGQAHACTGHKFEYASWCESRTCIALAICR